MADQLDAFIKDSKDLIGKEAGDIPNGAPIADWVSIRQFCAAVGDANPLYKNPTSGVATKYNSMIAPPTFVAAIRTPASGAAYVDKDYELVNLVTGARFEWVDVIRVGDRLQSDLQVTGVEEGSFAGKRAASVTSIANYRNSYGGLIGTGTGLASLLPLERGKEMLVDREIYSYSDQEIAKIENDIESESPPRGDLLRYWSDVEVGESLPQLVKGPVTLSDQMAWTVGEQKPIALGSPVYFDLQSMPGRVRTNPTTNWPYWDADQEFEDILSCRNMGFTSPPTRGMHQVCLAGQLVTDWMGDDGFLRTLDVTLRDHFLYGDTMWLNAKVVEKFEDQVQGSSYLAVKIQIEGANQLGDTILEGTATAYLPSAGQAVELPIPH